jgi:hypothetical protein
MYQVERGYFWEVPLAVGSSIKGEKLNFLCGFRKQWGDISETAGGLIQ